MRRRGFLSMLFPTAVVAQTAVSISADCHLKTTAKGDYTCYRVANVVPYGGFQCECKHVMIHWQKSDGTELMKCINGSCKNYDIPFLLPVLQAVENT